MKRGTVTALCLALLFSACRKADVSTPAAVATAESSTGTGATAAATTSGHLPVSLSGNGLRVTTWEQAGSWTMTPAENGTAVFGSSRSFPEITNNMLQNGVALVYAKGYNFADASMDKPLGMPFSFYLPFERMNFPVYWAYLAKISGIDVNLKMKEDAGRYFLSSKDKVQLRYFLFSPDALTRYNTSARALHNMSYTDLVTMLHIAP